MIPHIKASLIEEVVRERDKYVTKGAPKNKRDDELVKAAAATVGFFSELHHDRRETRNKSQATPVEEGATVGANAASQILKEGAASDPTCKGLAAAFLHRHATPADSPRLPTQVLTTPVLIPQRRPNCRARGFAPVYAPVLSTWGISQDAFLDFIITLNASFKPSTYLNAINLASFAGEASPEPLIGFLVGEAVETVTNAIMEAQSRMKSNSFLDKVNEGFFVPRGLFAVIATWRPDEDELTTSPCINVDSSTSQSQVDAFGLPLMEKNETVVAKEEWENVRRQVRRVMLPTSEISGAIVPAELVWPSAHEVAAATRGSRMKKKGRLDHAALWVDEYVDKHSQAAWTVEHRDHPLATSLLKPDFRSRYADPSHAASSGDIVALLTGGKWHIKENEKAGKEVRRQLEKEREERSMLISQEQKVRSKEYPPEAKAEAGKNDYSEINQTSDNTGIEQSKREPLDNSRVSDEVKKRAKSSFSNLFDDVGRLFYNFAGRLTDMHSRVSCTWSLCSALP